MRWRDARRSKNIERRRGRSGGMGGLGGLGGAGRLGGRRGKGGLGLVGILVVIAIGYFFGVDVSPLLNGGGSMPGQQTTSQRSAQGTQGTQGAGSDEQSQFIAAVLGSTEDVWQALFAAQGEQYAPPTLVDYRGRTSTACGLGSSAMGPFYCPADRKVYLDQVFFEQLAQRFGAPGDFAQAYVIAHEVGHHIQTLTGVSKRVHAERSRVSKAEGNALSVRQELQADCYSGVWAYYADKQQNLLEAGDIEEGLRAASAVGDDTLQRKSGGAVVPESFTHGTAAQRQRWFMKGYKSGDMRACDTFSARRL